MPRGQNKKPNLLEKFKFDNSNIYEIGIDEAGRGPLFGRVYASAVVLPKDDSFPHELMKDSKKFTSRKRLTEVAMIIMKKAIAYSVQYGESQEIDTLNPLQCTMKIMNKAVDEIIQSLKSKEICIQQCHLLVDGSYFTQKPRINDMGNVVYVPYTCVTSGDNTYTSIAAASILAKYHRDAYVDEMCDNHPGLDELYGLRKNKGYGTALHMKAIKEYGISEWHRRSFGICKHAPVIQVSTSNDEE